MHNAVAASAQAAQATGQVTSLPAEGGGQQLSSLMPVPMQMVSSATEPLKGLAQISVPDPQQIVIRPFDPSILKDIDKAIRSSDLGLTPQSDGKLIRLQIPPMSGDQRKKMVAHMKKLAEEQKVACRNVRRDANKALDQAEKDKELTEDDRDKAKEEVQKLLKRFEDKITELADKKAKEVMEQ